MSTPQSIPDEIRASVEANAMFDALRRGDFAAAARAQERLSEMGWYVSREPKPRPRRKAGRSVEGAVTC